jgi:hypothetical protein
LRETGVPANAGDIRTMIVQADVRNEVFLTCHDM